MSDQVEQLWVNERFTNAMKNVGIGNSELNACLCVFNTNFGALIVTRWWYIHILNKRPYLLGSSFGINLGPVPNKCMAETVEGRELSFCRRTTPWPCREMSACLFRENTGAFSAWDDVHHVHRVHIGSRPFTYNNFLWRDSVDLKL